MNFKSYMLVSFENDISYHISSDIHGKWASKLHNFLWRDIYHILIELILVAFIVSYFFLRKPYSPKEKKPLSLQEKEQLIKEWTPDPLVAKSVKNYFLDTNPLVPLNSTVSEVIVTDKDELYFNFASSNFLGIADHPLIKKRAEETILKYAVGSCGPRGFYGTTELHLRLEQKLAEFYGCEDSVIYSDLSGCVSSVIAAFSKKSDILVYDQGCNFFIKHGVKISRADIFSFDHNDLFDLERILKSIIHRDKVARRPLTRRFIVVEGLYQNYGDISQLTKIIALKKKYKFRIILDDSAALGVLSAKGSVGYWNVEIKDIDIYCAAMNHAYASACSFCVGSKTVCFFQRIGSSGYCFSASAPPFTCAAALAALEVVENEKERIENLRENILYFRNLFKSRRKRGAGIVIEGEDVSPIVHVRVNVEKTNLENKSEKALHDSEAAQKEILIKMLRFIQDRKIIAELSHYNQGERFVPRPSLKFYLTANHTKSHMEAAVLVLYEAIEAFCPLCIFNDT